MDSYIEYKFKGSKEILEIIMAELSLYDFDIFEEKENLLFGYVQEEKEQEERVREICNKYKVEYYKKKIEKINWNEQWEKNFKPIEIENIITVRADFHPKSNTPIDLIITPKMSFGTGHHSTTLLMLKFILKENIKNKLICDMGCGTGILGILCEKQGAKKVDAVDIDEWCFKNTTENIKLNNSKNIIPIYGDVEKVKENKYDIILANINKNILLESLEAYSKIIKKGGSLFLSGFYLEDKQEILIKAKDKGFIYKEEKEDNNWLAVKFLKK